MARSVFRWAMLAYAVSFWLVAVSSAGGSFMFGFLCASYMLVGPLMDTRFFAGSAADYVPFLITEWINIAFLATVAIRWRGGNQRAFKILRTTTLLMIPFCWIVLYKADLDAREGHVLWIASMVVALFSVRVFEPFDNSRPSLK